MQMKKYNVKRAKEYLQQARTANERIIQCNCRLKELREEYGKLTANYGENIGHGNKKYDTSDYIVNLIERQKQIEAQKVKFQEKIYEIDNFIFNLDISQKDEPLRRLLILRYVNAKDFDEIYQEMNYSYNYLIQTMHLKALYIVEKKLNEIQK